MASNLQESGICHHDDNGLQMMQRLHGMCSVIIARRCEYSQDTITLSANHQPAMVSASNENLTVFLPTYTNSFMKIIELPHHCESGLNAC
jgi:hypothetical protein